MLTNNLIELNSNENSLGMSDAAKQAVVDSLDIGFRYPDDQRAALITKVAEINGVTESQISLVVALVKIFVLSSKCYKIKH